MLLPPRVQAGAGGFSEEILAGLHHSVPTLRFGVLGQQLSPEDFDALLQVRRRIAPRVVNTPPVPWTVWHGLTMACPYYATVQVLYKRYTCTGYVTLRGRADGGSEGERLVQMEGHIWSGELEERGSKGGEEGRERAESDDGPMPVHAGEARHLHSRSTALALRRSARARGGLICRATAVSI